MAMLQTLSSLERGSSNLEKCLRDPSFSSYLSGVNEECYVINLHQKSFGDRDEEIGVFGAEKYFNERLDDAKPEVGKKSVIRFPPVQDSVAPVQPKAQSGAPSVHSLSSWNSQSALLAHRNPLVNGTSRARGRSYLGSFRCRCVCSDKNSVAVDEYKSSNEILAQTAAKETQKKGVIQVPDESQCMPNQGGSKRELYSTFKNLSTEDIPMKPRKSLEVFGLPLFEKPHKSFSFETERNLTTMIWEDSLPRSAAIIPTMAVGADVESDSDSSSDLFEIEDFTGKVNPFMSRNISGSVTPTAAYAPSEASIEWSVVTASAADFPITSDFDEVRPGKNITNSKTTSTGMNKKITATSDKPRRCSSSFLACNSQDSVKVLDHAHTNYEKKPETKTVKSQDLPAQVYRAQMDAKLTGFETARNMQLGISSRSLAQSNLRHDSTTL